MAVAFVLADDGLYYRDAILEGPTWRLLFDIAGAELTLVMNHGEPPAKARARMAVILDEVGIRVDRLRRPAKCSRKVGPDKAVVYMWHWNVDVASPVPKLFLPPTARGVNDEYVDRVRDSVIYDFK